MLSTTNVTKGYVLAIFSASAIQGEQNYGPYGNKRYTQGTIGTDKGYTGQFHDAVSGLDYYNARYYDPVAGVFLSPDSKQGNAQGMDPYEYVGGNPTTRTDPTGQRYAECGPNSSDCSGDGSPLSYCQIYTCMQIVQQNPSTTSPAPSTSSPSITKLPAPSTSRSSPTSSPSPTQVTAGQQAALDNAGNASSFFSMLANYANLIAGVLSAVAIILGIGAIVDPGLGELAAMAGVLAGVFWELGEKASELSRSFNDMTRAGDSWFTHSNLESQMWKVGLIGVGLTLSTEGALGAAGWKVPGAVAQSAGKKLVTTVTIQGMVVDLVGSVALGAFAEGDVIQENNAVLN